jgi:Na+-translocating ferredoxin:NAD+ oxidoreductase RnfG subunit
MMDFTWGVLGVLTAAAAIFLWELSKRVRLNLIALAGLGSGIILMLFSIAWAVGSVLEGVPRAASMGLLLFGMGGILLLVLTWRFVVTRLDKVPVAEVPLRAEEESVRLEPAPREPVPASAGKTFAPGRAMRYLAYLSLALAFFTGLATRGKDFESLVVKRFPEEKLIKVNDDPVVFQLGEKKEGLGNYVLIQEGQGYGGPFVVGVRIMDDGRVHEVFPLDHKETPAFAKRIDEARYGDQFIGKNVDDDFIVGIDVDAVSGATVSTMAATEAIRNGAHLAAARYFKKEQTWQSVPWKFGLGEILVLALFVLAFFTRIHTRAPWRYLYMVATVAITGFYLNASISIGNLSGLAMGYIPGVKDHLIWWTLTVGTVLALVLTGKNIYCFRICPFHGVQFLLNRISGIRMTLPPALMKRSRWVLNSLLWLSLMTIFLSANPALGAYEPFAMVFSLQGVGVQWFILPIALVGSFFFSSYWCRFFCPCGHALTQLRQIRRSVLDVLKRKQETTHDP